MKPVICQLLFIPSTTGLCLPRTNYYANKLGCVETVVRNFGVSWGKKTALEMATNVDLPGISG